MAKYRWIVRIAGERQLEARLNELEEQGGKDFEVYAILPGQQKDVLRDPIPGFVIIARERAS